MFFQLLVPQLIKNICTK